MLKLTKERLKLNLSKTQLGFETKIHPALIGKFESGKARPYKPAQERLEKFFDLSIDKLLEEIEKD